MRVTSKGQVTIPQHIRVKLNIGPSSEVDFIENHDRVYLVKTRNTTSTKQRFKKLRGIATIKMSTDEIMNLTREA
ncbi:MAG: AbrB/MazE/SpoVT family DNA-binding domain-containing protein [Deltaproteobacteria bacterium]|nr:AbrB/MazE/SpoVT family DNA-binding domain-containing protein [Candidatus Tharpella sp.]